MIECEDINNPTRLELIGFTCPECKKYVSYIVIIPLFQYNYYSYEYIHFKSTHDIEYYCIKHKCNHCLSEYKTTVMNPRNMGITQYSFKTLGYPNLYIHHECEISFIPICKDEQTNTHNSDQNYKDFIKELDNLDNALWKTYYPEHVISGQRCLNEYGCKHYEYENSDNICKSADDCLYVQNEQENDTEILFTLKRTIFTHVITLFEAYLSDYTKSIIFTNSGYLKKFVSNLNLFRIPKKLKGNLNKPHIDQRATEQLLEEAFEQITFHNLNHIMLLFNYVFEISNPYINDACKESLEIAVQRRHDCIHRNGYSVDGDLVLITDDYIRMIIKIVKDVTTHIHNQF